MTSIKDTSREEYKPRSPRGFVVQSHKILLKLESIIVSLLFQGLFDLKAHVQCVDDTLYGCHECKLDRIAISSPDGG